MTGSRKRSTSTCGGTSDQAGDEPESRDGSEPDWTADVSVRRRDLLGVMGAAGLAGLAGCPDTTDDGTDSRTTPGGDRPTETATPGSGTPVEDPAERILTDTNEVRPGYFTEFEGGIVVGAHPFAVEEPVEVAVERLDAGELLDGTSLPGRDPVVQDVVEVRAQVTDQNWVDSPTDTGFFVGLPVPSEFDTGRLDPLRHSDGRFAEGTARDAWVRTTGIYDPEADLFLVDVEALGGEPPTRLALVESQVRETRTTDVLVEPLLSTTFPRIEAEFDRGTWVGEESADGAASIEFLDHFDEHDTDFQIEWTADASESQSLMNDVEEALQDALPHYHALDHAPKPKLKTTVGSKLTKDLTVYQYFVDDASSDDSCGDGTTGFYRRFGQRGVTCEGATDPEETTAHELFHAIQYGFHFVESDSHSYIMEGFARLMEDVGSLLEVSGDEDIPPINLAIDQPREDGEEGPFRAYEREFFFYDLFHREGLAVERVGDLFERGLETEHLEAFVEADTSHASLADAHWRWVRNAAFEGDLDPDFYYPDCQPNTDALAGSLPEAEVSESSVVLPDDPAVAVTEIDLGTKSELSAKLVEVALPMLERNHYYEIEFESLDEPGLTVEPPRRARVYPDTGDCVPTDPGWDLRTYDDPGEGTLTVVNHAPGQLRSAYLLTQGPYANGTARVIGPYRHTAVRFTQPDDPVAHPLDENLVVTVEVDVSDVPPSVEHVTFDFAFDGTPIEPIETVFGPDASPIGVPTFDESLPFEFAHEDLCAAYDVEQFGNSELEVTLSALDGTGSDATVLMTDSAVLDVDPDVPEVSLSYDIEDAEWYPATLPIYTDLDSPPSFVVVNQFADPTTGVRLTGEAHVCDVAESADVSDGLRWLAHTDDEHAGAVLSEDRDLLLEQPDDFQDEDGNTIERIVRLEHETYDGELVVAVQWCAPHCIDQPRVDAEITERLFDPLAACPDGSFDADCLVGSVPEFERRLHEFASARVFDGVDPGAAFPLPSFAEWRTTETYTDALPSFARELSALASDSRRLATGEFLPFVHRAARLRRDWEPEFTDAEAAVASDLVTALSIGLHVFGSPAAGGENAWRYVGSGLGVSNPNAMYRDVDLRPTVESTVLGAGAAISRYADSHAELRPRVRTAGAYGFLYGVVEALHAHSPAEG